MSSGPPFFPTIVLIRGKGNRCKEDDGDDDMQMGLVSRGSLLSSVGCSREFVFYHGSNAIGHCILSYYGDW